MPWRSASNEYPQHRLLRRRKLWVLFDEEKGHYLKLFIKFGDRRLRGRPQPGRQHSFVQIDLEMLIQEEQLSVSGERMCTILINHLDDCGKTNWPCLTWPHLVDWAVKPQHKQMVKFGLQIWKDYIFKHCGKTPTTLVLIFDLMKSFWLPSFVYEKCWQNASHLRLWLALIRP